MTGILLVALQILLLLLRAHFNKDEDHDKAMASIKEAQAKLFDLATAFENKVRYEPPPKTQVDQLEEALDRDRKKETDTRGP
jgi:hypothetical protein